MNTILMRAVFRNEPPAEAQLEAERRLKAIVKLLAPESQPQISSGKGSFWISVEIVLPLVAGWLAIQTANWAFRKYILDAKIAPMLENKTASDDATDEKAIAVRAVERDKEIQLEHPNSGSLGALEGNAFQGIVEFLEWGKPFGVNEVAFKQLRTGLNSDTGVEGRIIRFTASEGEELKVEFLQVDTKDDFYAS